MRELGEIYLVDVLRAQRELSSRQCVVDTLDRHVQSMQDPLLAQIEGLYRSWTEIFGELAKYVLASLPDLVAESAVGMHDFDIERDVAASSRIGYQSEPERIGAALRDSLWEGRLLVLACFYNFFLIQVALDKLSVQGLQGDTLDNVERVDNVAQGFTHFPTFRIADQRMAIHLSLVRSTRRIYTEPSGYQRNYSYLCEGDFSSELDLR